jgi:hypothetical protein
MASRQVTAGLCAPHTWLSRDLSHVICKSAAPICSISFPCAFHILLLPQRVHRAYPCCLHHLAPRSHITPATEPPCAICNLVFSWLHACVWLTYIIHNSPNAPISVSHNRVIWLACNMPSNKTNISSTLCPNSSPPHTRLTNAQAFARHRASIGQGTNCISLENHMTNNSKFPHCKYNRGGTRTRNLLLRREAPYPLGHTSI